MAENTKAPDEWRLRENEFNKQNRGRMKIPKAILGSVNSRETKIQLLVFLCFQGPGGPKEGRFQGREDPQFPMSLPPEKPSKSQTSIRLPPSTHHHHQRSMAAILGVVYCFFEEHEAKL